MKFERVLDKEGNPRLIITDSMRSERRRLANAFIDELLTIAPTELVVLTKEELEQKLSDFKQSHPLQENKDRGYLDLYLVKAEALSRVIEERGKIIQAGNEIPDEGVHTEHLLNLLYEALPDKKTF